MDDDKSCLSNDCDDYGDGNDEDDDGNNDDDDIED